MEISQYQKDVNRRYLKQMKQLIEESEEMCIGTLAGIERLLGGNYSKVEPLLHGLMKAAYLRGTLMGKLDSMANKGLRS